MSSSSNNGFEENKFMKDLIHLRDTQEAIQGFSAWCIKHRKAAYKIARCWLKIVKKVRVDQKLTLFYLLNDIVQHCRRKNYSEFLSKFESVLKEAMPHLKDDKINAKLLRCINIWSERSVFSESFLEDIKSIIIDDKDAEEIDNFQPTQLCTQIKIMKALEDDTDYKLKTLKDSEINIMDIDSLRQTLKDRQDGNDFISDFEKSTSKMQDYIKAIDKELGKRRKVIELLSNGGKYYDSLLGEANIVANAYTNFEKRLMNLKKKLGDKIPELEQNPPPITDSPIPSPDYDAPSPVNDEYELKLPGEEPSFYNPGVHSIPREKEMPTKKQKTPSNGTSSRDLNSRLHSLMSSSASSSLDKNTADPVVIPSGDKSNISISEFLTRLAEGKPSSASLSVPPNNPLNGVPSLGTDEVHQYPSPSVQSITPSSSSYLLQPENKWWTEPPPPPPPPLPQHSQEWNGGDTQDHHPSHPGDNSGLLSSSKTNLINLINSSSSQGSGGLGVVSHDDMDVVSDSDQEEAHASFHPSSSCRRPSLSLQDRLKNLAGMPLDDNPPPPPSEVASLEEPDTGEQGFNGLEEEHQQKEEEVFYHPEGQNAYQPANHQEHYSEGGYQEEHHHHLQQDYHQQDYNEQEHHPSQDYNNQEHHLQQDYPQLQDQQHHPPPPQVVYPHHQEQQHSFQQEYPQPDDHSQEHFHQWGEAVNNSNSSPKGGRGGSSFRPRGSPYRGRGGSHFDRGFDRGRGYHHHRGYRGRW